jgi:hypothetical protein
MRSHWRPDASFLARRTRDQLFGIAGDCGYADGTGSLGTCKKFELVSCLIRFFQTAQAANDPAPAQQKARHRLPDAMLFPAVGADGTIMQEPGEAQAESHLKPTPIERPVTAKRAARALRPLTIR